MVSSLYQRFLDAPGAGEPDPKSELILKLARNRVLAHQTLFRHRHPDGTPQVHEEVIELWHARAIPRALVMAFREFGKSTIAEEALVIMSALKSFRNAVIIGENQERAIDRLTAIKYEIANNEYLIDLFGELKGHVWNEGKVILTNGVILQALGRGQEVRGMKHLDMRPDFCFGDDMEGKEHVRDAPARKETLQWLFGEVIPALDKKSARIRINATPLDRESLPMTLLKQPGWTTKVYPIRYKDEKGEWAPTWEQRYPLDWIAEKETEMRRLGLHHEFMREYMCEPDDPSKKIFTEGMFKVEPRVHVWQPTYAFYDPARTTKATSATTGWAVWSWIANRLIVWDGGGGYWKPDEIIDSIFKINETYNPVMIGVEEDGLNEFIMQPLRQEMVRRSIVLPVTPMRAPRGKLDFIGSLQPFFLAGEVTFAKDCPELRAQFLSFPTGNIDGPNALAYAPRMRPGQIIFEDFSSQHVVEQVLIHERIPLWLTLNATSAMVTGVLVQLINGAVNVISDYVQEGDPGASLRAVVQAAQLEAGRDLRLLAGARHFEPYDTVGLRGAVAKLPQELKRGGSELDGRAEIRAMLTRQVRGRPVVQVAHAAHWTLNAFCAGYAREVDKTGIVKQEAREGIYRVLMEGLESFAGLLKTGIVDEEQATNWAYTETGQRYKTILPGRRDPVDEKVKWLGEGHSLRSK